MRWDPHVTVATIVERNNQFLFVEENCSTGAVFNQPAGHWEDKETLIEAARRETLEETGWHVAITHLCGIYQWRHPDNAETFLRFCFVGECLHQDPTRELDPAIIAVHWLSREQLLQRQQDLRSPMVLRCLVDYLDNHRYPLDFIHSLLS
ncbi:MAG: NUDIX hydrolase [Gammaproteobacteria bacterium]|nr:MAG: NUDIX hydrolase [Gammaproteobacteria bacterium]